MKMTEKTTCDLFISLKISCVRIFQNKHYFLITLTILKGLLLTIAKNLSKISSRLLSEIAFLILLHNYEVKKINIKQCFIF